MATATLTALERLRFVAQALGCALLGAAALFGWALWDESTRLPHGLTGAAPPGLAFVLVLLSLGAIGWNLGRAVVPARVVASKDHPRFAAGSALLSLGVVFALPSPMACITWPIAAGALAGAAYLILPALRAPQSA